MIERDISTEKWRTYHYGNEKTFTVNNPVRLFIKTDEKGDSHRVVGTDGVTYYPVRGWIGITWFAPEQNVSF